MTKWIDWWRRFDNVGPSDDAEAVGRLIQGRHRRHAANPGRPGMAAVRADPDCLPNGSQGSPDIDSKKGRMAIEPDSGIGMNAMGRSPRANEPSKSSWRERIRRFRRRLCAGVFILVVLGFGGHAAIIGALRWWDVPASAFMIRSRFAGQRIQYRWTDWQDMAPALPMAVLAAEDQRFPVHWGFDMDAIADAIRENADRRRPRGASTITQQTAKNLFLWPGHSWIRKGLEAYTTALLELLWSKQRILEVYLNVAQFGPGVYGVGAAGAIYFKQPASRLTLAEASRLAAVLPNPRRLHVDRPSAYVLNRAMQIRQQVTKVGGPEMLADYLAGNAWVFEDPPVPP